MLREGSLLRHNLPGEAGLRQNDVPSNRRSRMAVNQSINIEALLAHVLLFNGLDKGRDRATARGTR